MWLGQRLIYQLRYPLGLAVNDLVMEVIVVYLCYCCLYMFLGFILALSVPLVRELPKSRTAGKSQIFPHLPLHVIWEIQQAASLGLDFIAGIGRMESSLFRNGIFISRGTSTSKHQSLFPISPDFQVTGRGAVASSFTTNRLMDRQLISQ